jgi:ParB-like nuclease domain
MSASNRLSSTQFLPMHELLKLPSNDAEPSWRDQSVAAVIRRMKAPHDPKRHEAIRQSMIEHGQTEPLPLSRNRFGVVKLADGHHRVKIANDLGWPGMYVYNELGYDSYRR